MKEFDKVLFPADLTESSEKIAPYVRMIGKKFEAQIHLLFAVRAFEHFANIYVPSQSIIQFETEAIKGAQKRLCEFVGQHFDEFPATQTAVVSGDPTTRIISYIGLQHIDLVIMGTHGRKGMEKIIFGSVADGVLKTSPVPVIVVNPYR